jgi:hypothetical protein
MFIEFETILEQQLPWAIPSSNGQAMYLDFQLVRVNEVQHGLHWSYDQSPEAPFGPRVDHPSNTRHA